MTVRRQSLMVVLALSILVTGCKTVDPFIVSGESLDTVAKEFIAIGQAMNKAHDEGKITDEQYRKWGAFAVKFKVSFRVAVAAWNLATSTQDALAMANVRDTIHALSNELSTFAPLVIDFAVEIQKP